MKFNSLVLVFCTALASKNDLTAEVLNKLSKIAIDAAESPAVAQVRNVEVANPRALGGVIRPAAVANSVGVPNPLSARQPFAAQASSGTIMHPAQGPSLGGGQLEASAQRLNPAPMPNPGDSIPSFTLKRVNQKPLSRDVGAGFMDTGHKSPLDLPDLDESAPQLPILPFFGGESLQRPRRLPEADDVAAAAQISRNNRLQLDDVGNARMPGARLPPFDEVGQLNPINARMPGARLPPLNELGELNPINARWPEARVPFPNQMNDVHPPPLLRRKRTSMSAFPFDIPEHQAGFSTPEAQRNPWEKSAPQTPLKKGLRRVQSQTNLQDMRAIRRSQLEAENAFGQDSFSTPQKSQLSPAEERVAKRRRLDFSTPRRGSN